MGYFSVVAMCTDDSQGPHPLLLPPIVAVLGGTTVRLSLVVLVPLLNGFL